MRTVRAGLIIAAGVTAAMLAWRWMTGRPFLDEDGDIADATPSLDRDAFLADPTAGTVPMYHDERPRPLR